MSKPGDPILGRHPDDKCLLRGHPEYLNVLNEIRDLHIFKSAGYGTEDDAFANFSAVSEVSGEPRYLYPVLRSIEKLTRVMSLHAQGRVAELEEEFKDVASLLLCATALVREDADPLSDTLA